MFGVLESQGALREPKAKRRTYPQRSKNFATSRTQRSPLTGPAKGRPPALAPLVLVVDDFLDAREVLADGLKFLGYRTAEAVSGYEAIEKVHHLRPTIVLMDLAMPGIDGFETARRLKADKRTRSIPIIAITGQPEWTYEELAKQAGCDSFLTKPVSFPGLRDEIRRVLDCLKDLETGGEKQ